MSSDPLLPDLPDVPEDVPDTPNTDPDKEENQQATGEEQAQENRETESPS